MPPATLADLLVPGITGALKHATPYPPALVPKFHTACHAAARKLDATITRTQQPWQPDGVWSGNFHITTLEPRRGPQLHILLHSVLPIVALASSTDYPFPFISPEPVRRYFEPDFLIADDHLLSLTMDGIALPDTFGRAERYDIKYWEPRTVGELAFNCYD